MTLDFVKLKSGMIVATVFALWFSVYFNDRVETILSYVLIMSFGILHGANDIRLIKKSSVSSSKTNYSLILVMYVLVVLGILTLFYFFPPLALIGFILVSGYHFGEQHLEKNVHMGRWGNLFFFSFYGIFILFMLFYIKDEQVMLVLTEVTQVQFSPEVLKYGFLISGSGVLVLGALCYKWGRLRTSVLEELFVLGVFFVIFNTASLLWSFCIYFIVWHSIPSLKDQMDYLYGVSNWATFGRYIKDSFLYWSISVLGLLGLLWFLNDYSEHMVSILIYFLAAITFPHVVVMSRLGKTD